MFNYTVNRASHLVSRSTRYLPDYVLQKRFEMGHHGDRNSDLKELLSITFRSRNIKELERNLKVLEKYFDVNDSRQLLELGNGGSNLINQALHVPFKEHGKGNLFAEKISFKVVELLLNKMQLRLKEDDFQNKILSHKTGSGFMPLQDALATGSMRIVDRILRELKVSGREAILEASLANCTKDGFVVLQHALTSGSERMVEAILRELKVSGREEILKSNLANRNKNGFIVLDEALVSGSEAMVEAILGELKVPGREAILEANLANCTGDGFVVLQSALKSGRESIVEAILRELKVSGREEILEASLANCTNDGFVVLQHALTLGSERMVEAILGELKVPGREAILEANLANCTKDGFTVLQSALKSGREGIFEAILRELKVPGREAILEANLANCTKDGFMVLQHSLTSGSERMVKAILGELKVPGCEAILEANLANCTKNGFMVLQSALNSGRESIVEAILGELKVPGREAILEFNLTYSNNAHFNVLHNVGMTDSIEIFYHVVDAFFTAFGNTALEKLHQLACLKNKYGYFPSSKNKAIQQKLQSFRDWVPERADNSRKSIASKQVVLQRDAISTTNKSKVSSETEPYPISRTFRSRSLRELNDNLKVLEEYIDRNDSNHLLKIGIGGSNLINQALHIPIKEHGKGNVFAEQISFKAVELLLNKMQLRLKEDDFQNKILSHKTGSGFMPLQDALATGSMRIVDRILRELKVSGREAILEASLANCTKDGFMVLDGALKSGSEAMVEAILGELKVSGREEILEANLANCTIDGFMVLDEALKSGSEAMVEAILGELKVSGREAILEANLANCTKDGFMVLQSALKSGREAMVEAILGELKVPGRKAILEANLANCTKNGFMVLQSALKSGRESMVEAILGELKVPGRKAILEANLANCTKNGFMVLQSALKSGRESIVEAILRELKVPGRKAILEANLANCTKDGFTVLHSAALADDIQIFNHIIHAFDSAFGYKAPEVLHQLAWLKTQKGYLPLSRNKAIQQQLQSFRNWVPERADNFRKSVARNQVESQRDPISQTIKSKVSSETESNLTQMRVKDSITLTTINDAQADLGEDWHNDMKKVCYIMLPTTNRPPYRDLKAIAKDLNKNLPWDVKCILMVGLNNQDNSEALVKDVAEFRAWYEKELLTLEVHIDGFNWQLSTGQDSKIKVPFGAIRNRILTSTLKHLNEKYAERDVTKVLMTLDSDTILNSKSVEDLFNGTVALEAGSLGYVYDKSSLRKESKSTGSLVGMANVLDMRLRKRLGDLGYLAECSLFMKGKIVEDLQARIVTLEEGKDLPLFTAGGAESRGLIKYCNKMNYCYGQHFDVKHAPVLNKIPSKDDIDWGAQDGWAKKNEKQKYQAVKSILFNHTYSNANYRFFLNQMRFVMGIPGDSCQELSEIASVFYIPKLIEHSSNKNFAQLCDAIFASLESEKSRLLSAKPKRMSEEQYRKVVGACYDWSHEVATFIRDEMGKLPEMRLAIKYGQGVKVENKATETVRSGHFGTRNMYYGTSKILADEIAMTDEVANRRKRMLPQDSSAKRQRVIEVHKEAVVISPIAQPNQMPAEQQSIQPAAYSEQALNAIHINSPILYSDASKRRQLQEPRDAKRVKRSSSMTGIADPRAENSADEEMMNVAFMEHLKKFGQEGRGLYDNPLNHGLSRSEIRAEERARKQALLEQIKQIRDERESRKLSFINRTIDKRI